MMLFILGKNSKRCSAPIYNYNENFLDKMKNNYIKMNNLLKKGIDD